ncbi:MAG: transcription-repair coupling factor [Roseburia sp.]
MNTFLQPVQELEDLQRAFARLKKERGVVQLSGCMDAQKSHMIFAAGDGFRNKIIVTFSEQKAKELQEDYMFFDREVLYYPAKDILFFQSDLRSNQLLQERLSTLKRLAEKRPVTVVLTYDALMNKMPEFTNYSRHVMKICTGQEYQPESLVNRLVEMGYTRNYQVESPGEFAMRGGILDIYPLTEENPYRIEFWDDEVDSIRSFDAESQRSIENISEVLIYPSGEFVADEDARLNARKALEKEASALEKTFRKEMKNEEAYRCKSLAAELCEQLEHPDDPGSLESCVGYLFPERVSLLDYFDPEDTLLLLDEPARLMEKGDVTELEFTESMKQRMEKGYILPGQADSLFSCKEIAARLQGFHCLALTALDLKVKNLEVTERFHVQVQGVNSYNNSFSTLVADLKKYKKNGYRVVLLSASRTRAQHLAKDLLDEELTCFYAEEFDRCLQPGEVMVGYGKVKRGYAYPLIKFVVVSESDIFGQEKKKKKRYRRYEGEQIHSFGELKVGDYVVHENHGLGIYRGIEKIEVDHKVKDYIKIEYAKGGNLYILATQLELIQKYAGAEGKKPKLNSLGSPEWQKTKTKVKGAVQQIAHELVELYAVRQNKEGYMYSPDTVWQKEFEEMFPFEETEDQELAIAATKRDMESNKIMDRLICGDVGYGKTEVAIRAAFKAVQDGKQVVYLVPTTILAQQHYNTFSQRMKDFPVRVDLLCRFRSSKEQKKTIEDLKKGMVDIVIGTHRVLSADVSFKDLGLLIIDEEQRFGVTHKEKIKQMKKDVDVLTLTATPIPRTLHMSLIGIRDMCVLEEPPRDRMAIQTYVMEYNEEMVREAINRELARNGQVYYVFNRVQQIAETAARIAELVPEANVAYAHGQMNERELENIMYQFINGEIDVLVSTTIIETGLDISNVNTIIIHDADNMGLSQLYQLRGRVGRSNRTAYAFLMYRRDKLLKEVAEKRLAAIKEFTDLGSGFKIAMRDLEIRGAGNLLGAQQHGHMEAVGYDLYCKMLNEAVKREKGEENDETFDTSVDIKVDAYIPADYVPNENQKLDLYKRIAAIIEDAETDEMLDELTDRFGDPPKSVLNLLAIARLKCLAHRVYIKEISEKTDQIKVTMYEKAKVRGENIPRLLEEYGPAVRFVPEQSGPYFLINRKANSRIPAGDSLVFLMEYVKKMEQQLLWKE